MLITLEEREKERLLFDAERRRAPKLFLRPPMIDDDECLRLIGIEGVYGNLPIGYLKLWPQDFIVEEISQEGTIHSVDSDGLKIDHGNEGGTFYADLVKVGISTLEAEAHLSQIWKIIVRQVFSARSSIIG